MPDLGKYAIEVLSAYALSLLCLAIIVILSVASARHARKALAQIEAEEAKRDAH